MDWGQAILRGTVDKKFFKKHLQAHRPRPYPNNAGDPDAALQKGEIRRHMPHLDSWSDQTPLLSQEPCGFNPKPNPNPLLSEEPREPNPPPIVLTWASSSGYRGLHRPQP